MKVDLRHIDEVKDSNIVEIGVDLSEFYTSVEWDILEVPAVRNEKYYTCCDEPYLDITFNITMRRKTLFYTVSLSISILLSLTVFFLLLAEIIPPTSLVVPLLGKFVLFTMILDTFSICVTVVVLNVHFRSPQTHTMAPWVRRVFIHILPRLLVMRRPQYQIDKRSLAGSSARIMVRTCNGLELRDPTLLAESSASELVESTHTTELFPTLDSHDEFAPRELEATGLGSGCRIHGTPPLPPLCQEDGFLAPGTNDDAPSPLCRHLHHWHNCPELHKAIDGVKFIADHTKREEDSTRVKEDWKYVAMVLDRLFLWIFTLAVLVGTAGIILQAPTLYDDRIPIDVRLSEIASTTAKPHGGAILELSNISRVALQKLCSIFTAGNL
ncbi:Acetylcholine receptor subunit beta-like 2 [Blattella germanica]|nr:Acetylcholine receptor subunit beta-like 2 [Blattella germanica]